MQVWVRSANAMSITTPYYSFIQDICIAPLQVHYYSEALPTDTVSEFHAEALR